MVSRRWLICMVNESCRLVVGGNSRARACVYLFVCMCRYGSVGVSLRVPVNDREKLCLAVAVTQHCSPAPKAAHGVTAVPLFSSITRPALDGVGLGDIDTSRVAPIGSIKTFVFPHGIFMPHPCPLPDPPPPSFTG